MTTHKLKTLPDMWDAVRDGRKTFDLRANDRGFQAGDILELQRMANHRSREFAFGTHLVDAVDVRSGRTLCTLSVKGRDVEVLHQADRVELRDDDRRALLDAAWAYDRNCRAAQKLFAHVSGWLFCRSCPRKEQG